MNCFLPELLCVLVDLNCESVAPLARNIQSNKSYFFIFADIYEKKTQIY